MSTVCDRLEHVVEDLQELKSLALTGKAEIAYKHSLQVIKELMDKTLGCPRSG